MNKYDALNILSTGLTKPRYMVSYLLYMYMYIIVNLERGGASFQNPIWQCRHWSGRFDLSFGLSPPLQQTYRLLINIFVINYEHFIIKTIKLNQPFLLIWYLKIYSQYETFKRSKHVQFLKINIFYSKFIRF